MQVLKLMYLIQSSFLYSTLHTDSLVGDSDQVPYVAKHEVQSELASQGLPSVVVPLPFAVSQ